MANVSGAIKEELEKISFEKNDVVQINENGPEGWIGCLGFVEELKDVTTYGLFKKYKVPKRLMIGVEIPKQGTAYIFVKSTQVNKIGKLVLIKE